MLVYFIAWCFTHYPDCRFLYISFSKSLAEKHTSEVKAIMSIREYQLLFGVELAQDSQAKGDFRTTLGGAVAAFGSQGAITGRDAGCANVHHFSGCVIIDDPSKPDEINSVVMREAVIDNYSQTIKPRPRGNNVGILLIGQRLHEEDLPAWLEAGKDGNKWKIIKLKSIDEAGNALAPNIISKEKLLIEKEFNPYVFSSQYQQEPVPASGGIFQRDWFVTLDIEPKIVKTFITVDTAETEKTYNDASVFSLWGIYKPIVHGREIPDLLALHCIDAWEIRVEPKDLVNSFLDFWAQAMQYKVKPSLVAIEKKSTGSTLVSYLKNTPGIRVHAIERSRASGSKTERFLRSQPFVANKLISFPSNGRHTQWCIDHMAKITANDTHAHDDYADCCADAIQLALIDKLVSSDIQGEIQKTEKSKVVMSGYNEISRIRQQAYYSDY
jgi:predicted phage terminase large subunit-like protein